MTQQEVCRTCGRPVFRGVWGFESPAATDCKAASEAARGSYVPDEDYDECTEYLIASLRETVEAIKTIDEWAIAGRHNVPQLQRDARGESWTMFVQIGEERVPFTAASPAAVRALAAERLRMEKA